MTLAESRFTPMPHGARCAVCRSTESVKRYALADRISVLCGSHGAVLGNRALSLDDLVSDILATQERDKLALEHAVIRNGLRPCEGYSLSGLSEYTRRVSKGERKGAAK